MAVSAGSRIAAVLWVAAVLIAAFPASAQTNDPNLTQEDLDCLDGRPPVRTVRAGRAPRGRARLRARPRRPAAAADPNAICCRT